MVKARALVLGVNGQDGSYLTEALLHRGWVVHGVGRQAQSIWIAGLADYHYHTLDINDTEAFSALLVAIRPDFIFHMAAVHGPSGFSYEEHWREAHGVNTLAAHAVLEYLRREDPRGVMIYASSSKAFGLSMPSLVNESSPRHSTCIYSTTKNAATDLITYYRERHGLRASIVWTFNHESARRGKMYFIPKIVDTLAMSILHPGFVGRIGTLQFASDWGDAVEYMDIVADVAEHAPGQDFVLATGATWRARDLVERLFQRYGLCFTEHLVEQHVAESGSQLPAWHADLSALRRAIGRTPRHSILEVCSTILRTNHPEAWRHAGAQD